MMTFFFFTFIFLAVYSYVIYPLILIGLNIARTQKVASRRQSPAISLIISAFNEETVIGRKLDNSLALDYPRDRLEIIVVSDNSTDKTDEIVRSFANRGVTLFARPTRQGKSAGLNDAVRRAQGEIMVFSDANSLYERDALKKMARWFSDPRLGLVTGSTKYVTQENGMLVEANRIYTKLEHFIKRLESRLGSCVGADGAIFAVRRDLYQPLAHDDINDFVIPLNVVSRGYRAVLDEDLFCTEEESQDGKGEFKRQIRITNRTLRAIFRHTELLNPVKFPAFSFQLISHKIIRFCGPFFLMVLLPLNLLMMGHGLLYGLLFVGQTSFYVAAIIGWFQGNNGKANGSFRPFYHFLLVNASVLLGWFRFLTGQRDVIWDPQRNTGFK